MSGPMRRPFCLGGARAAAPGLLLAVLVLVCAPGCKGDPPSGADASVPDLGADLPAVPDRGPDARVGDLEPGPRRDWGGFPDLNVSACRDVGLPGPAADAAAPLTVKPAVKWKVGVSGALHHGVKDPGGAMYFTGRAGIQQVHPDGRLGWLFPLPPNARAITQATVTGGLVVFGSDLEEVHAVWIAGKAGYSRALDGPMDPMVQPVGRPALAPGGQRYYVGGADDKLYAVTHQSIVWRRVLPGPPTYTVLDDKGTLYAPLRKKVAAVDSSGKVLWIRPVAGVDGVSYVQPTVQGGLICAAGTSSRSVILELDRACGRERWRRSFSGYITYGFVRAPDGTTFTGESDRKKMTDRLLALSPTGQTRWSLTIEKSTFPDTMGLLSIGPIGADGTLYVFVTNKGLPSNPSGTAHLRAYTLSGTLKWKLDLPDLYIISKPLLLDNGLLVFAAHFYRTSGKEYTVMAVQTTSPGLARGGWPRYSHDNLNTSRLSAR